MRPSQPSASVLRVAGGMIQPTRAPRTVTRLTPTCLGTVRCTRTFSVAWSGEKRCGETLSVAAWADGATASAAKTTSTTRRTRARLAAATVGAVSAALAGREKPVSGPFDGGPHDHLLLISAPQGPARR